MANIITYKSKTIQQLTTDLDQVKYNPTLMQAAIFNYLDEITNGEVDIVDPTNPFVFLLEASTVNTSLAITENLLNLRKQYPSLAQDTDELYNHMSNLDYINRFATPSTCKFTFTIQVNDILTNLIWSQEEKCYKATIPRDTFITINELTFTLAYPIDIRRYPNESIQLSYDATIDNPLYSLTTNIIDHRIRNDSSSVPWMYFDITIQQLLIVSNYYTIQKASIFEYAAPFTDSFYTARVYYSNNATNNQYKEMYVTHTDQVFDQYTPTAVLKVSNNVLTVMIPAIYVTNNIVSGEIRVDIYTTKGDINVDLSNFTIDSFTTTFRAINEVRDTNEYTSAINSLSIYSFSDQIASGGSNEVDFLTLRARVINNSIGERKLPITNNQIQAYGLSHGFEIIKNVDVLTNRIFLATRDLPVPTNTNLITSANIGISTVVINTAKLALMSMTSDNGYRMTLLPDNLAVNKNGIIEFLTESELTAIRSLPNNELVALVNSKQFLYTPFYYVLDNSTKEFKVRIYDLAFPKAKELNFVSQNQSLQLNVNSEYFTLTKTPTGYRFLIQTKSSHAYKLLEDGLLSVQLGFVPVGEKTLSYINGDVFVRANPSTERVFYFDIETNHDIDSNNNLFITNSRMFNVNEITTATVNLTHEFHIFYATTSVTVDYTRSDADDLLGVFLLPQNSVVVTHETITFKLGSYLQNLWSRSRIFANGLVYKKYPVNEMAFYDRDIYRTDPTTGSIFTVDDDNNLHYEILHHYGDPIIDVNGNQVILHKAGDPILGPITESTNVRVGVVSGVTPFQYPIIDDDLSSLKEIDILFIDGKYKFTTEPIYKDYSSEVANVLDTWITDNIVDIQSQLLEQTKIYFYPKTTLGLVNVNPNGTKKIALEAEQSLVVDLYVNNPTFVDMNLRASLERSTIALINSYISKTIVNINEINIALTQLYGNTVASTIIRGLGGIHNFNILSIAEEHNRLCLKKKLVLQQDSSLILKEDVLINFFNLDA